MNQQRKVGIFIQWGFHELRSILLSGLAKELNSKYEAVIYTFDKNSILYQSYLEEAGCAYKYLDKSLFKVLPSRIDAVNQSIRKAYMRINGVGNFRNYERPKDLSSIDFLKGNKLVWNVSSFLTRKTLAVKYQNEDLIQYFKEEGLTDILMAGYYDINNQVIAFSAKESNIKVWSLVNSWKDMYTNDFVSFTPDGLFTWSDNMAKNFVSHNPHLKGKVKAIGNPAFDVFFGFKPIREKSFYELKYGIKPGAKIFVYTMINPLVTNGEHFTIRLIYQSLKAHLGNDWHLLVRKNPLHHDAKYTELEELENLSFMEHYWEWDALKDLAVQEKAGEDEWYDMIYYSACNISVASTVSMEFLIAQKPVINIGFNGTGNEDENLKRFSEAPFYRNLCKEPNVFICNTIEQFNKILINFSTDYIFDKRFQLNEYFKSGNKSIYSILPLK
ncbi:MAG: hypothetical protein JWP81_4213 [Ferruginibacter sp.]|nr:hypothetical protein [Ferruginibacter sp.]